MSQHATRPVLAFVPDALTASRVGTWETDFDRNRTVSDATTAALFGIDPKQAATGLPLAVYAKAIHPDDLSAFYLKLGRVREKGGLFVVEYRTRPSGEAVRWVLARGRYERDPHTGGMIGRGIVIDITESKLDGQAEDRAFFIRQKEEDSPLDRIADLALQARYALDETGERGRSDLRRAIDGLLWAVGRSLAREGVRTLFRRN